MVPTMTDQTIADTILYEIGKSGLGMGEGVLWKDGQALNYLDAVNHATGERLVITADSRYDGACELAEKEVGKKNFKTP